MINTLSQFIFEKNNDENDTQKNRELIFQIFDFLCANNVRAKILTMMLIVIILVIH